MSSTIGLWGPTQAGKTVFLCQLHLQLQNTDWQVFPDEDAQAFLRSARVEIAQNRFPAATAVGTAASVTYHLRSPAGSEYKLALTDHAGAELVEMPDHIKGTLTNADALLLLMDSGEPPQTLQSSLKVVLDNLHVAARLGAARDPRPVSICLTKIDGKLSAQHELNLALDDPPAFVRTHVDPDLEAVASRWLENFKIFPISAAGVFTHGDVVEGATFYDEKLQRRLAAGGRSVNLLEPLVWIVEHLETRSR